MVYIHLIMLPVLNILTIVFFILSFLFAVLTLKYNKKYYGPLAAFFGGTASLVGVHPSFTAHNNSDWGNIIAMDGIISISILYLTAKLFYLEIKNGK